MDRISKILKLEELTTFFDSLDIDSYIILPPMKLSNPTAIQWSKPEIKSTKLNPANQPIIGMEAWKNPKKNPVFKASIDNMVSVLVNPLVMDTEKESIAKPTAISIIMIMSISGTHFSEDINTRFLKKMLLRSRIDLI